MKFWIWLKRFRKRRGYGVHSPFAFNFITTVIYQKGTYYNYERFNDLSKDKIESDKLCKLLFRLVNFSSPKHLLYLSPQLDLDDLFRWAKSDVQISHTIEPNVAYDFIYWLPIQEQLERVDIQTIFEQIASNSILVIYGIGHTALSKKLWHSIITHPLAGISFDLYDLGIVFFDKEKNKQDYIVNF